MSDTSFAAATAFTKEQEGGYTCDSRDSGNWSSGVCGEGRLIGSNMGVGAPALISWLGPHVLVTAETMRDLSAQTYSAIARARYWRAMSCDVLPIGLDVSTFDFGWNVGDGTSIRVLQKVLGVEQDGDCGPDTLAAVFGTASPEDLIVAFAGAQENYYRELSNFSIYGNGWLSRTVAREEAAVALLYQ